MKKTVLAFCLLLISCLEAHAVSGLSLTTASIINNDANDIVFAEIADNSDSVIFLKKDLRGVTSADWSFFLYSIAKGDTRAALRYGSPDVFYGFTVGPDLTVIYAKDAEVSVGSTRSIYYGNFNNGDSAVLVSSAAYPAYVASDQTYNFAYVKDADNLFVGGLRSDTAAFSAPAVKIFDLTVPTGAIRFPRWSPDAQSIVFMQETTTESQAFLYAISNVQTLAASGVPITSLSDSSYLTRLTGSTDTYYNAFPHFVGGDQFVLYTRANPYRGFKFSNFSDTGGCTSVILQNTNWDAMLHERNSGTVFSVDTATTTAAVSSAVSHRGYVLLVADQGDTDGDLTFAALKSTLNVTAASSGTFYFPTNARLTLQAGAVPTSVFTVEPDTPTDTLLSAPRSGDVEAVVVPVQISSSVPTDSMDIVKIEVVITYHDVDVKKYLEMATIGQIYDSTTSKWKSPGGSANTSLNFVTFNPPHFSAFGVGVTSIFNVALKGESCIVRRWISRDEILGLLRGVRDGVLNFAWGRSLVRKFYEM